MATRAERLAVLCERMAQGATYIIQQQGPRAWQVRVTDPVSGDSIGGVGETIDAALTALEAKIR